MTGASPTPDIPELNEQTTQHATCVTAYNKGALIIGVSGSGKSSLALAMMGFGAKLATDDRVILRLVHSRVIASAPAAIDGLVEARGIGLLRAKTEPEAPIKLVIDLDQNEQDRLPPIRHISVLGQSVSLLYKVDMPHFPAALMQYLACGRQGE